MQMSDAESGRGRWVGIRFPAKRPALTPAQLDESRASRIKALRAHLAAQRKARAARSSGAGNGGLVGLYNLGNTCFLSSAVQCLSFSLPLTHYFRSDLFVREINNVNPLGTKGGLVTAYAKLIKQMWRMQEKEAVEPRHIKLTISRYRPQFSGNQQHDAQELLSFLLDGLHEDLNRVKVKPYLPQADSDGRPDLEVAREQWANYRARDDSVIVDLFTGLLKSSLRFARCGRVSTTFDPYTSLSLPLPEEKVRHIDITVVWCDGEHRRPTKFCIQFAQDALTAAQRTQTAGPPAAATPAGAGITATTIAEPESCSPSPFISPMATVSASSSPAATPARPGIATSTRILDIKVALSQLCGVSPSRLQVARVQLSSFDIYKRAQFTPLGDLQHLSEFALSLQTSAGVFGNKNDTYFAFEVPVRDTTHTEPATDASTAAAAASDAGVPHAFIAQPSALPHISASPASSTTSLPTFHTSPFTQTNDVPLPNPAPAPASTPSVSFPTSYGGVNGSVCLGMKFDVKDSVSRWEVATVHGIRLRVPEQVMRDCGGTIHAAPDHVHIVADESDEESVALSAASEEERALGDHEVTVNSQSGVRFRSDECEEEADEYVDIENDADPDPQVALSACDADEEDAAEAEALIAAEDRAKARAAAAEDKGGALLAAMADAVARKHALQAASSFESAPQRIRFLSDHSSAVGAPDLDSDDSDLSSVGGRGIKLRARFHSEATSGIGGAPLAVEAASYKRASTSASGSTSASESATRTRTRTRQSTESSNESTSITHEPRFSACPDHPGFVFQHITSEVPRRPPADYPPVELRFRFDGFSTQWDEWVPLNSARIAPFGSGLTRTHGRSGGGAGVGPGLLMPPAHAIAASAAGSTYTPAIANAAHPDLDLDPSWVRVHLVQRCIGRMPSSVSAGLAGAPASATPEKTQVPSSTNSPPPGLLPAQASSTNLVASAGAVVPLLPPTPSVSAGGDAAAPYDVHFFSVPMLLWLDPRTTTRAQLYEQVWARLKRFTRLPDTLEPDADEVPVAEPIRPQAEQSELPPEQPAQVLRAQASVSVSALENIAAMQEEQEEQSEPVGAADVQIQLPEETTQPAAASLLDENTIDAASPLPTTIDAPVAPPTAEPDDNSAASSGLPPYFSHPITAPFVLRWTNRAGTQCTKCGIWNKSCIGCPIELDAPVAPEANAASSSSSTLPLRDTFLVDPLMPRSSRDWSSDTTLCIDFNVDYFTCGLVDIDAMQDIELDESVRAFRERQAADPMAHVDLNACLSLFTTPERLEGDAAVYCSRCRTHEPATKTLELYSTPPILVLHLKRLLPDTKLYTQVDFPLEGFDPTPFLSGQSRRSSSAKVKPKQPSSEDEYILAHQDASEEKSPLIYPTDEELEAQVAARVAQVNSAGTMRIEVVEPVREPDESKHAPSTTSSPTATLRDNGAPLDLPMLPLTVQVPSSMPATPAPSPSPPLVHPFTPVAGGFDASAPSLSGDGPPDQYDLYAVVNHVGAVGGGHYVTYCLSRATRQWHRFDDATVTPIDASDVVTSSAYMLFYERRGLSPLAAVDATPSAVKNKRLDAAAKKILRDAEGQTKSVACAACNLM